MKKFAKHKDKIAGLIISLIFIVLICKNLDLKRLVETFKIFDYKTLLIFTPLYIFSVYIRGIRWKYLLCSAKDFTVKEAFFSFTACNALNAYLPARAGDFWRAYHIGKKLNLSKAKVLGSIILERIIDGISVLLILASAVILYCKQQWVLNITYLAAALFFGSLMLAFFAIKFNKTDDIFNKLKSINILSKFRPVFDKTAEFINNFVEGFESLNNTKCFSIAFFSSCMAWGIECYVTYVLISGFGFNFGFSIAMFVISFLALSTIIPSSSVFVGPYQYAYILALGIYGISKSNALGIAFVHQIAIMLIISIISIIYFLLNNTDLKEIKKEIISTQSE